jgi:hypothetical protein
MRSQSGCRWQLLSAQPPFMAFNALSAIHLPISDHIPMIPNKRKARTLIGRAQSAFTIRRTDHSSWRVRRSAFIRQRQTRGSNVRRCYQRFVFFFFSLFAIQYLSRLLHIRRYICPNNNVRHTTVRHFPVCDAQAYMRSCEYAIQKCSTMERYVTFNGSVGLFLSSLLLS